MKKAIWMCGLTLLCMADSFYFDIHGNKRFFIPIERTTEHNGSAIRYYRDENGYTIGTDNSVIVRCISKSCDAIFKRYPVVSVERLSAQLYLLTFKHTDDPFRMAQRLYKEKEITLAQPNFIKTLRRR